jgi:hypothetical protein
MGPQLLRRFLQPGGEQAGLGLPAGQLTSFDKGNRKRSEAWSMKAST